MTAAGTSTPTPRPREGTWPATLAAAGSGLAAIDAIETGDADGAFLAIRPPGHHARARQAMGFCLVNNVAVTAAELRARGRPGRDRRHRRPPRQRDRGDLLRRSRRPVRVVPRVAALPGHRPATTRSASGAGEWATCNLPLPAGATGDVYLAAYDEVVAPLLERFAADWLLISAGFDAHRDDPITGLGPVGRRLRRARRPAARAGGDGPGPSPSSRAATRSPGSGTPSRSRCRCSPAGTHPGSRARPRPPGARGPTWSTSWPTSGGSDWPDPRADRPYRAGPNRPI